MVAAETVSTAAELGNVGQGWHLVTNDCPLARVVLDDGQFWKSATAFEAVSFFTRRYTRFKLIAPHDTPESWVASDIKGVSRLRLECTVCGVQPQTTSLKNFACGGRASAQCNCRVALPRSAHAATRKRIKRRVEEMGVFTLDGSEKDWTERQGAQDVDVRCLSCGVCKRVPSSHALKRHVSVCAACGARAAR